MLRLLFSERKKKLRLVETGHSPSKATAVCLSATGCGFQSVRDAHGKSSRLLFSLFFFFLANSNEHVSPLHCTCLQTRREKKHTRTTHTAAHTDTSTAVYCCTLYMKKVHTYIHTYILSSCTLHTYINLAVLLLACKRKQSKKRSRGPSFTGAAHERETRLELCRSCQPPLDTRW